MSIVNSYFKNYKEEPKSGSHFLQEQKHQMERKTNN